METVRYLKVYKTNNMTTQAYASQKQNCCKANRLILTDDCSGFVIDPTHLNHPSQYKRIFAKPLLCVVALLFIGFSSFAQSYLGTIIKQVNFREGAGIEYDVIGSIKQGSQIFIVSLETENDFYNIIDITTNKEGYVHKSFVKVGKRIKENDKAVFSSSGETTSYKPEVEVFNNTSLTLTLKLNSETYSFSPKQKRTLTIEPGSISYRASASGIIPVFGSQILQSNQGYTWQFYIVTRYK